MAITAVARSTYNSSVSYNERERTWEAVFEYHVQGTAVTIEEVAAFFNDTAGTTFLPKTITIDGVTCYAAARRVDQLTTAGYWPVSQIYRGRVIGSWKISNETQIAYITQLQDLVEVGGEYAAIGADSEGAPRQVPIILYRVDYIVSILGGQTYMDAASKLVGAANEDGWITPWWGPVIATGAYLCAGARLEEQYETNTAVYSLFFSADPSRPAQHIYAWRQYTEEDIPNTKNRVKRIYGLQIWNTIQPVAGRDGLPDFADMIPPP